MGTNQPWNWRLTVHKAIKETLIQSLHDQFQDECQNAYVVEIAKELELELESKHFHGSLVTKTPCSKRRGPGFNPWSGN